MIERWDQALIECARQLADPKWEPAMLNVEIVDIEDGTPIAPHLAARERAILVEWARRATTAGVALAAHHESANRGDHPHQHEARAQCGRLALHQQEARAWF